jgi:hypothetical protein
MISRTDDAEAGDISNGFQSSEYKDGQLCFNKDGERSKVSHLGSGTCIPVRVASMHENVVPSLVREPYPYRYDRPQSIH